LNRKAQTLPAKFSLLINFSSIFPPEIRLSDNDSAFLED
jgi:hypothetical protein